MPGVASEKKPGPTIRFVEDGKVDGLHVRSR